MTHYYFMAIAIFGMVGGVLFLYSRFQLLLNGARMIGEVQKKQKRTWTGVDGGGYAQLLVIAYTGIDGKSQSFSEQNSLPAYFYDVGDKIKLLQDPNKPNKIMVHSYPVLFSAPLVMLMLAGVAGYVGFKSL